MANLPFHFWHIRIKQRISGEAQVMYEDIKKIIGRIHLTKFNPLDVALTTVDFIGQFLLR